MFYIDNAISAAFVTTIITVLYYDRLAAVLTFTGFHTNHSAAESAQAIYRQ